MACARKQTATCQPRQPWLLRSRSPPLRASRPTDDRTGRQNLNDDETPDGGTPPPTSPVRVGVPLPTSRASRDSSQSACQVCRPPPLLSAFRRRRHREPISHFFLFPSNFAMTRAIRWEQVARTRWPRWIGDASFVAASNAATRPVRPPPKEHRELWTWLPTDPIVAPCLRGRHVQVRHVSWRVSWRVSSCCDEPSTASCNLKATRVRGSARVAASAGRGASCPGNPPAGCGRKRRREATSSLPGVASLRGGGTYDTRDQDVTDLLPPSRLRSTPPCPRPCPAYPWCSYRSSSGCTNWVVTSVLPWQ